jgi:hypothetical protein
MTTINFLQAAGIALIPSLVWGWLFVSRNPESLQLVVVTFLLGTLAVVPLLLFMAGLGVHLQGHELYAATHGGGGGSMRQALSLLAFLGGVAVVLFGVIKLFELISRRVTRHALRLAALAAAALLLLAATLSHDQLHDSLGAAGPPLADLFHVLVLFALFLFLLERLSSRMVANATLAALAAKAVKEVDYHRDHAAQWVLRLGDGTAESHARMQAGLDRTWPYVPELFETPDAVRALPGIAADPGALRPAWATYVENVIAAATLAVPTATWRAGGGRTGYHTENLGHLLPTMQNLHRSHPGVTW